MSALSNKTEKRSYTMDYPGAEPSPPERQHIDVPKVIAEIKTKYGYFSQLFSVSCLGDENIWTSGNEKITPQLTRGTCEVQTKSGNYPQDKAVNKSKDLIYTDKKERTVNIVNDALIEPVIKTKRWKPSYICSTSSGDLLDTQLAMMMSKQKLCVILAQQFSKTYSSMTKDNLYILLAVTLNTLQKTETLISV